MCACSCRANPEPGTNSIGAAQEGKAGGMLQFLHVAVCLPSVLLWIITAHCRAAPATAPHNHQTEATTCRLRVTSEGDLGAAISLNCTGAVPALLVNSELLQVRPGNKTVQPVLKLHMHGVTATKVTGSNMECQDKQPAAGVGAWTGGLDVTTGSLLLFCGNYNITFHGAEIHGLHQAVWQPRSCYTSVLAFAGSGHATLYNAVATENNAGSVLLLHGNSHVSLYGSEFANNTGWDGAAVLALGNTSLNVNNCTFTGNSARQRGGAIAALDSTHVRILNNSALLHNRASLGGAIFAANAAEPPTQTLYAGVPGMGCCLGALRMLNGAVNVRGTSR